MRWHRGRVPCHAVPVCYTRYSIVLPRLRLSSVKPIVSIGLWFGGSNPPRENGSSVGRVHKKVADHKGQMVRIHTNHERQNIPLIHTAYRF